MKASISLQRLVPWALTLSRFALGAGMLAAARMEAAATTFVLILVVALLTDIFDGVLARRWGTVTAALRVSDSLADVTFYSCVAITITWTHPALTTSLRLPLVIILTLLGLRWIQDLTKYRRLASYHATLSRASGALVFAACVATFCSFYPEIFFWCAFAVGVACHLEAMAMTVVLPEWTHDVSGLKEALRRRDATA